MARRKGSTEYTAHTTSADASGGVVLVSGVEGKIIYIQDLVIACEDVQTVKLQDEDNTVIIPNMYVPATSVFAKTYEVPIAVTEGKDLEIISSIGGNITATVTGYIY